MHFVKKVPTTEEEKELKRKEREKKVRKYIGARDRIFEKRQKKEFDDEILTLTAAVLEKNSDNYTMWNIRRETIQLHIDVSEQLNQSEEATEEAKAEASKTARSLLSSEMYLTELCAKGNPKSYSTWFQRGWVLEKQKEPKLKEELLLCEKALQLDCRNFHVWDHRRFVAKLAGLTAEEELEFSNKLIGENFSNYSAWHYRSILIQKVFEEKTGMPILDQKTIAEELEKVKSAFYMDAEDQSVWMYTRWLLDIGSRREFLQPGSITPIVPLTASFHGSNTTVVMSRACPLGVVLNFVDVDEKTRWRGFSALSSHPKSARVWQFLSDTPLRVAIEHDDTFHADDDDDDERTPWVAISEMPYVNKNLLRRIFTTTSAEMGEAMRALLADCDELAKLEPNNKWPLYMKTLVQMEFVGVEQHDEIIANLKRLGDVIDPKRKQMYAAVASRQELNAVLAEGGLLEQLMDGTTSRLALRYKDITSLEGVEYLAGLVQDLDVTGNQLTRPDECVLPNLESLTLNENPIKKLSPSASFGRLNFLSLAATHVANLDDVMPCVQTMSSLERFLICETPLVEKAKDLADALPGVRLIPYYV